MGLPEQIQSIPTEKVGIYLAGIGGSGMTLQSLIETANDYFLMGGNAALMAGGLYLMWHKINQLRNKKNSQTRRTTDA